MAQGIHILNVNSARADAAAANQRADHAGGLSTAQPTAPHAVAETTNNAVVPTFKLSIAIATCSS